MTDKWTEGMEKWKGMQDSLPVTVAYEIMTGLPGDAHYLDRLPGHMHRGVAEYVIFGTPTGSFLEAVFSNDLVGAFAAADDENTEAMRNYAAFLYSMRFPCFGSPAKYRAWVAGGGALGPSHVPEDA